MTKSDPFGFDMSVASAKKKATRTRRGMSGASETSTRVCEHEGCELPGKFRAPRAPDVLDEFKWFCQEHIREYNLKWNFFSNTTEAEINAQMSKDKVWERETGVSLILRRGPGQDLVSKTPTKCSGKMPQKTLAKPKAEHAGSPRPNAALSKSWMSPISAPRQTFAKPTKPSSKCFIQI